jgi:hypothetical protein
MLTVSSAASSRALTTLQAVKDDLGLSDGTDDARLIRLIDQASDAIERHCARRLARESVVETFRPARCLAALLLERIPVATLTSIVEDGTTLTVDEDFEADLRQGMLWRLSGDERVDWTAAKVVVSYAAGYVPADQDASDVPPALSLACRRLVVAEYHGSARDGSVRSERQEGVGSVDYFAGQDRDGGLPPGVAALLAPFVRFS